MTNITDSLSKAGATYMAAQLDAYWHAAGALHVKHTIHPAGSDRTSAGNPTLWVVRSNLVRGNPPSPSEPLRASHSGQTLSPVSQGR